MGNACAKGGFGHRRELDTFFSTNTSFTAGTTLKFEKNTND
jgi:hypothetical protein